MYIIYANTHVQEVVKGHSHLESVAATVTALNAWHPTHLDEPDYERRIEGFSACCSHLNYAYDLGEIVLLMLNNAMFFLLTVSSNCHVSQNCTVCQSVLYLS